MFKLGPVFFCSCLIYLQTRYMLMQIQIDKYRAEKLTFWRRRTSSRRKGSGFDNFLFDLPKISRALQLYGSQPKDYLQQPAGGADRRRVSGEKRWFPGICLIFVFVYLYLYVYLYLSKFVYLYLYVYLYLFKLASILKICSKVIFILRMHAWFNGTEIINMINCGIIQFWY